MMAKNNETYYEVKDGPPEVKVVSEDDFYGGVVRLRWTAFPYRWMGMGWIGVFSGIACYSGGPYTVPRYDRSRRELSCPRFCKMRLIQEGEEVFPVLKADLPRVKKAIAGLRLLSVSRYLGTDER